MTTEANKIDGDKTFDVPEPALRERPDDIIHKTYKRAMNVIFLRDDPSVPYLPKVMVFIIGAIFFITISSAEPHLRGILCNLMHIDCMTEPAKDLGKQWCDFMTILSQVMLVAVVGGIVVTEDAVRHARNMTMQAEIMGEYRYKLMRAKMIRDIDDEYFNLRTNISLNSWRDLPKLLWKMIYITWKISLWSKNDAPVAIYRYLSVRFMSSCPGGLYGIVALCCFEGVIASQAIKGIFDYTKKC